eukprot:1192818-Prorocentrum_minimum.AAC.2
MYGGAYTSLNIVEEFTKHRESDDPLAIAERAREFFRWFGERPEQQVLVSTHSCFLWHVFNHAHPGYIESEHFDEYISRTAVPVVNYLDNEEFEEHMRARWLNCEIRSIVVDYS